MATITTHRLSRREALRGGGQLLATATGATMIAGTAAAEHRDPYEEQPSHIDLYGYGNADGELDTYRPWLDLSSVEIRPTSLYCWRHDSSKYDETAYAYWAWYPEGQTGVSSADSHVPDREPAIVFVHDGEIDRVLFDRYHYLTGVNVSPPTFDATHPTLRVVDPWHPYRTTTAVGQSSPGLEDMHDVYSGWQANDWGADAEAVLDPWRAERRGHWWTSRGQVLRAEIADLTGFRRLAPGDV